MKKKTPSRSLGDDGGAKFLESARRTPVPIYEIENPLRSKQPPSTGLEAKRRANKSKKG